MAERKGKLLFIGVDLYDYDRAICNELCAMGYEVSYVASAVRATIARKIVKKLGLSVLNRLYDNVRVTREIANLAPGFDEVLVFKGDNLTARHIDAIRRRNPRVRIQLYEWDALFKVKNAQMLLARCDRAFSFDMDDCLRNSSMIYRPMFYLRRGEPDARIEYQLVHIGEERPGRRDCLRRIIKAIPEEASVYMRLKTSVLRTVIDRIKGSRICANSPLPYREYCRIVNASQGVLDIKEFNQSGVSMRSVEVLAMGKHLYTTNPSIASLPYVNPSSYTVVDPIDPHFELGLDGGQSEEFYEYFSLRHFLNDLLN